jgi:Fur family transcriptional regulator, ferric uptake regulator
VADELAFPDGVRATAQRRAVARAVEETAGAFTVQDLHDRARALEPRLGLATTYRTLELLRESGGVHPLLGEGRTATYVRCRAEVDHAGHHHHLVCTTCGGVEETELCAAPAESELERRHGFRAARHELDIYGTCRRCA